MDTRFSRREFLGAAAAAGLTGAAGASATPPAAGLPKRLLGRTGYRTSILGLGMAPIGMGGHTPAEAERLVNEAIDLGVNYLDVAPNYANGEEKLGPVMQRRRQEVFLVTKVEAQQKSPILDQIRNSLRLLKTDHVDAVHLHNLGDFKLEEVLQDPNGGLAALQEAKRLGYLRFIGISGHLRPWKFAGAIATGQIDLVMAAINFVDRHTYNFEETILPLARQHNTAVVAMKVLGGARGMVYNQPTPALLAEHYENAIRYALGLPGISAVILGLRDSNEIRQAVQAARRFRPLSRAELAALAARGKQLATTIGPHFGPVV
jgi:aryl-alcohol dehydrogenase-like predicted oxidoreductase